MANLIERIIHSRHNILEIITTDFKSSYTNPIVILLLIAIIILPSLYGLVNIYACWDPYENTDHVQFAVANEDKGATYENMTLNAGNDLVKMLKNNTDFDWVFVTSDELRQGVHDGKYYAGIVVPANFSESIVSITTKDPHSAHLEYIVNEKYPVAAKLSDAAAKAVYNNINAEIVTFINVAAYGKLGELQAGLASGASEMSSGAVLLSNGAGQVSSGAGAVSDGANQLSNGANDLANGADRVANGANDLSNGAGQVATGAGQVADGTHQASTKVNQVTGEISNVNQYVQNHSHSEFIKDEMNKVNDKASNISQKVNTLDNGAHQVADGANSVSNGATSLADGANAVSDGANKLNSGASELSQGTLSLAAGAELLANSAASALFTASSSLAGAASGLSDVTGLNDSQVGDYFYAPVKLDRNEEFQTSSYGSQVSPFYIVLSMWVGALITCVIVSTGSSIGTKFAPHEMYFGKMLLFNILAILQTTVTLLGAWHLGIDIANPLMFIFSCYFVAIIFMTLVYSLISVFGDVGKGVAIILLVFQISGTGGIYPVEIMNKIFAILYPYLPMTHAINLVRESQLGLIWSNYIPSFVFLLILGGVVTLLAIILKQRFDKHTKYFEEKLHEANLFK
ncbi:YhgE/Pip family protein [Methanobrevibacter sp.]|uniref:YhgE/Pip family protein n=1 Tax=Methanobrevibacter sp. TaxID=66852 RepID=UPI00388D8741